MTLQSIIKIGNSQCMIVGQNNDHLVIENLHGRRAKYYPKANKIVFRHSVTGRFCSKRVEV